MIKHGGSWSFTPLLGRWHVMGLTGQVQRWPLPKSVSPCGLERVLGRPSDHGELGNDSSISEAWVPALPLPPVLPLLASHLLSVLFGMGIAGEPAQQGLW